MWEWRAKPYKRRRDLQSAGESQAVEEWSQVPPLGLPLGSIAYELPQSRGNLIADLPEYHGLLVSGGGCRVLKAMVQPPACTGENGARLLRVVTHRKNVIELLSRKLVY